MERETLYQEGAFDAALCEAKRLLCRGRVGPMPTASEVTIVALLLGVHHQVQALGVDLEEWWQAARKGASRT